MGLRESGPDTKNLFHRRDGHNVKPMNTDEPTIEIERIYRSMDDIKRLYPDEWVILVDINDAGMVLHGGVVYAHSPNRKALQSIFRAVNECRIFWTGRVRHPFHYVEMATSSPSTQSTGP